MWLFCPLLQCPALSAQWSLPPWFPFAKIPVSFSVTVLAYGIHFIVDFFAVAGPALLPIYVIEIGVFVMAAGTLVMALKMGRMEEL